MLIQDCLLTISFAGWKARNSRSVPLCLSRPYNAPFPCTFLFLHGELAEQGFTSKEI